MAAAAVARAPAVGIDLGTTYSCVGVYEKGIVTILSNQDGKKTTPSYVAFTPEGRLIGDQAKDYATMYPEACVDNVKRLIGRSYNDPTVQDDKRFLLYDIVNHDSKIQIQVKERTETKLFSPEEISSMVLKELKAMAERHLNNVVTDVVITVPAYFTDSQRRATLTAGRIAGLNVLRIINEPTAAALAYGFDKQESGPRKLFIYDFGGGTFDVSIVSIENGIYEVISTDGDTHLGGLNIDNLMLKHMGREFQRTTGIDIKKHKRAMRRLRVACEKAKVELSTQLNTRIELDSLAEGKDFTFDITRVWFEDTCEDILEKTKKIVYRTLAHKNTNKSSVTDVILVGGSTRMPMVKELLKEIFNGKQPSADINPDEAVAYGAAIQAAIDSGVHVPNTNLRDVTPLSLGVGTKGSRMSVMIARNTLIPAERTLQFSTQKENQTEMSVEIFEGEGKFIMDNSFLASFTLSGIPPAPLGIIKIPITFKVDRDNVLHVSAYDKGSGQRKGVTLDNRTRLTPEAIERAIQRSKEMDEADKLKLRKIHAKDKLDIYRDKLHRQLRNPVVRDKIASEDRNKIIGMLEDTNELLRKDPSSLSIVNYQNMHNELEEVWKPLVAGWYRGSGFESDDSSRPFLIDGQALDDDILTRSEWVSITTDGRDSYA